jgi:hypothetical protein
MIKKENESVLIDNDNLSQIPVDDKKNEVKENDKKIKETIGFVNYEIKDKKPFFKILFDREQITKENEDCFITLENGRFKRVQGILLQKTLQLIKSKDTDNIIQDEIENIIITKLLSLKELGQAEEIEPLKNDIIIVNKDRNYKSSQIVLHNDLVDLRRKVAFDIKTLFLKNIDLKIKENSFKEAGSDIEVNIVDVTFKCNILFTGKMRTSNISL